MSTIVVFVGMILFLMWPFFVGVLLRILAPRLAWWFNGAIGTVLWAGINIGHLSEVERLSPYVSPYIAVVIELALAFLLAAYGAVFAGKCYAKQKHSSS